MKEGGKQSNELRENFGFYGKQEGNERVDLMSHVFAVGQNKTTEQTNRKQEQSLGWQRKAAVLLIWGGGGGYCIGVCWAGNQHVRERCEVGGASRGSGRKPVIRLEDGQ
jgi:hypothetical protein